MEAKAHDAASIQSWCINYVARILDTPPSRIDPNVEVERLGLDSSTAVALIMSLEEHLGIELMPELLFEYPTLASISKHLATKLPAAAGGA
ncbi:acyl carrier protein [Myxococcus fulvus]|uniref:acyl carrier protein n=1 Tax=Myxococcus fulvus TaxID=33 RepID=UPI003B99D6A0